MRMLALSFFLIISGVAYGRSDRSRLGSAHADLAGIKTAFEVFAIDYGRYPTTSEGVAALLNCPTNIPTSKWRGPYLGRKPIDPWGDDYVYRCPGIHNTNSFDLYSCGADGISKSGGNDLDDINNWNPASPLGGDYPGLSRTSQYFGMLRSSRVFAFSLLILQVIPILGMARLVASVYLKRVRNTIAQHPVFHFIWFAVALALFLLFVYMLIPQVA
jgi:general secretion pathway protein G